MKLGPLARKAQRDECGGDSRRWVERFARNLENDFRARVKLCDHRKVAVITRAGLRGKALGDFSLNDEVHFIDSIREREKVMKDRRSNVIGKIAVDSDAAAGRECDDVGP